MAKFVYPKFGVTNPIYQKIVTSFPSGMQMAFAYGSGVFKQQGQTETSQKMMDFIFVVNDPVSWHRQNLKENAHHYSFLRRYGPGVISAIQESSAGLYFNPMVPFGDRLIKYGVISNWAMAQDLVQWRHLYISGRLHKPVVMVKSPDDEKANDALKTNLKSAVHTSLLLLPEKFTEVDLFMQISSLSYTGDIRMSFGEDQNKVRNIVNGGIDNFRILYKPLLLNSDFLHWDTEKKCFEQEYSHRARRYHLDLVPGNILRYIYSREVETLDGLRDVLAQDRQCNNKLYDALQKTVSRSSKTQSAKGILTGGFSRSTKYGADKVKKWFGSRNK
ncbi:phosphatidate cytidylyltransferase, mitochondrial-like [Ylistrum balloti]|uniref:phosphatidate cytidylyltransferase, mitochondrial-like n=1 Tax=Ylistrum balloti TaxID=509963 RepID=UPI002905C582|nr:phosphatidate cytidylyltransferase, mitochondrial-like [Ylistrum balloti]